MKEVKLQHIIFYLLVLIITLLCNVSCNNWLTQIYLTLRKDMDVAGPNKPNSLDMSILPKVITHLLIVVPQKKYSLPSAWLAAYRAPEADADSPCTAAHSSLLTNVVHASTPPAARLRPPLILHIYSQPVPVYILPRGHWCSMSAWRKTTDDEGPD
jgi:hypothetical protein